MLKCGKCGKILPDESNFCMECGAPIDKFCSSCGFKLPPRAKFCCECGAMCRTFEKRAPVAVKVNIPNPVEKGNILTDMRDGQSYRMVTIGNQVWLAENFRFNCSNSFVYANSLAHVNEYGRLYTWEKALHVAPPGWRLPTRADFNELIEYCKKLGGGTPVGTMLKSCGDEWKSRGMFGEGIPGKDMVSFCAKPIGSRTSAGVFNYLGHFAYFWCADEVDQDRAYYRHLGYFSEEFKELTTKKDCAFSVRLIKNK